MQRLALVGPGRWGRILVESVQGVSKTVIFTQAVARSPAKAAEWCAAQGIALSDDLTTVLSDPQIDGVVLATPHSQRSVARISVELTGAKCLWFEDLIEACRRAVPTETQVMVKREDEQAFAELNAANPICVEDAARLFCQQLLADVRIGDFRVISSHQESLHSHDAVSVLTEGELFESESLDPKLFSTLFHVG